MFGLAYGVYVTNKILILRQIGDDLVSALGLDQLCGSISSVIGPVSIGKNKVRNALVANRSVFKLFLTELNPTILKIFHVSQSVTMCLSD